MPSLIRRRFPRLANVLSACLAALACLAFAPNAAAATGCTYLNFSLGFELVAVEGPNAAGEYRYATTGLRCSSAGEVIYDSGTGLSLPYDMGWRDPVTLVSAFQSAFGSPVGRLYVSGCGTHLLFVNRFWSASRSIAGIPISHPVSTTPYVDVFESPIFLQPGTNIGIAKDPTTQSCALRPDSGLNNGMCMAGVDNGLGSTTDNGTNPINPAWRGNKTQRETDFTGEGASPLSFVRTYSSRAARVAGLTKGFDSSIAGQWTHTYQRSLQLFVPYLNTGVNTVQSAAVFRPDGKIVVFRPSGSNWVAATGGVADTLAKQSDGTWRYVTSAGEVEIYSAAGRLVSITSPEGIAQTLAYDANGRLATVTDPFGRALAFGHDAGGRLTSLTEPGGGVIQYGYDTQGNLASATYPGGQARTYHYENANFPKALTGIGDESGQRYASFAYDGQGRAISSEHGAAGSGIDHHGVTYNANGTVTIQDALSSSRTFTYQDQFNTAKLINASQPGGSGCGPSAQSVSYASNGFVQRRTNFNNVQTTYVHDGRGLQTQRVEAAGKPEARTISTQWHGDWRLPARVAEPKKRTTYVYNGDGGVYCAPQDATVPGPTGTRPLGVLCSRTEEATTDANGSQGFNATLAGTPARAWQWTYDARGQVLSENGPRTDVNDVTTYGYYTDATPDHAAGDLATVTNALGHLTRITAYDGAGRPLTVIDANGNTITYAYWPRGGLRSVTLAGKTTTYDYTAWGGLQRITRPNGGFTDYRYDSAHRLIGMSDSRGDTLHYVLDNAGNVLQTDWTNPDASIARSQRFAFDALGRLQHLIETRNGEDVSTLYGYDANGNRTSDASFRGKTTTTEYDGLDRPLRITDPLAGLTQLAYDGQDRLTGLTAPNQAATSFTIDGLGNVQEASADRGSRPATFDAAGNLKTLSDGRGTTASFTYDALNRPLTIAYPQSGENVTYTWDTGCANGIGRLCQASDKLGSTRYAYDARGNLESETRTIGTVSLTTRYTYDDADRPITTITPSGKVLTTSRDADGRIGKVAGDVAGTPIDLVKDVQTDAAGNVTAQTFGNGTGLSRQFSDDGLPIGQTVTQATRPQDGDVPLPAWALALLGAGLLGALGRRRAALVLVLGLAAMLLPHTSTWARETLTYDADGNIVERASPSGTTTYGYDALGRLDSEAGPAKTQSLGYDANGNRTSDAGGSHTYTPHTNRPASVAGQAVSVDAAGNVTQLRNLGFVWNQAGYLAEVRQGTPAGPLLATYDYDHKGRRLRKSTTAAAPQGATTTLYLYDHADRLLVEADGAGNPRITYVWRDDTPVALIRHGTPETVLYLETDHLNTPRAARNQAGQVVWRWESDAFGSTAANEDPAGTGTSTTVNLRFPGQYFDKESGLHYNWHRYYDPKSGRYVSSDPIGVAGGVNTYGYVGGDPISRIDPTGRIFFIPALIGAAWGTGGSVTAWGLGGLGVLGASWWIIEQSKTPNTGEAGSCHINPGSGQERKYGADGLPEWDIDWDHDHGQGIPHGHNWDRGPSGEPIRGPGVPISPVPRDRERGQ